jgi:hypothetical protein
MVLPVEGLCGGNLKSLKRGGKMDKEKYLGYIDHFNNKRYDELATYFSPDLTVEFFSDWGMPGMPAPTMQGRQGFIDAYKELHQHVREVLELGTFMVKGNQMFAELHVEFHCFKDHPSVLGRPMKKGEVKIMSNWILYDLENDIIKRIRIAHFRMIDPKLAKY